MKEILIIAGILFGLIWIISYASCINRVENLKEVKGEYFINFEPGTSTEELADFAEDMRRAYPAVTVSKYRDESEECARPGTFDYNYHCLFASLHIQASMKDLGKEKEFDNFITNELNKYKSLKISKSSGSPTTIKDAFDDPETSFCMSPIFIPNNIIGLFLK